MHTSFFGTDGIRTEVGKHPLKPLDLVQLGIALGHWIHTIKEKRTVLIAHDSRISASFIEAALKTGLLQYPLIIASAGLLPTPALHYIIKEKKMYDIGIMITASHNQYQDNGIKIITQTDGKLNELDEKTLIDLY